METRSGEGQLWQGWEEELGSFLALQILGFVKIKPVSERSSPGDAQPWALKPSPAGSGPVASMSHHTWPVFIFVSGYPVPILCLSSGLELLNPVSCTVYLEKRVCARACAYSFSFEREYFFFPV